MCNQPPIVYGSYQLVHNPTVISDWVTVYNVYRTDDVHNEVRIGQVWRQAHSFGVPDTWHHWCICEAQDKVGKKTAQRATFALHMHHVNSKKVHSG